MRKINVKMSGLYWAVYHMAQGVHSRADIAEHLGIPRSTVNLLLDLAYGARDPRPILARWDAGEDVAEAEINALVERDTNESLREADAPSK